MAYNNFWKFLPHFGNLETNRTSKKHNKNVVSIKAENTLNAPHGAQS
jgi:hypothetical protein